MILSFLFSEVWCYSAEREGSISDKKSVVRANKISAFSCFKRTLWFYDKSGFETLELSSSM